MALDRGLYRLFPNDQSAVDSSPVLAYFNPDKEVVIQFDSSGKGLGAVLLQEGKPVEFASRSLTPSEQKWAHIAKEALAL